jgi:hypothetical protein
MISFRFHPPHTFHFLTSHKKNAGNGDKFMRNIPRALIGTDLHRLWSLFPLQKWGLIIICCNRMAPVEAGNLPRQPTTYNANGRYNPCDLKEKHGILS